MELITAFERYSFRPTGALQLPSLTSPLRYADLVRHAVATQPRTSSKHYGPIPSELPQTFTEPFLVSLSSIVELIEPCVPASIMNFPNT